MKKKHSFSVGICAFNEAKNIQKLLKAIEEQKLKQRFILEEIIVVASGCTDETVEIVEKAKKKDKRIKLIVQKRREGKAVAVNIFLETAKNNLLFLQSADTIPSRSCYSQMLTTLTKVNVGLVGCQVIPLDEKDTFLGFINSFKWLLHHKINTTYTNRPKVGELIAFKKLFTQIPPETAVDEASIEPLISLQGFKIAYNARARVYNQGPTTVREFLSGRRRIYAGHFATKIHYGYEVVTFSPMRIIPVYLKNLPKNPKLISYAITAAALEFIARFIGYLDIKLKLRDHTVWKISDTTKHVKIKKK